MNPNYLRNPNFCVRCFEVIISKICNSIQNRGKLFYFCDFFSAEFSFAEFFWRTKAKFILLPLQKTRCTLDFGIAVHSYIGIQMWINWTLGSHSIAHTDKHQQASVSANSGLPVLLQLALHQLHSHHLHLHRQAEVQGALHFLGTHQTLSALRHSQKQIPNLQ